MKIKKKHVVLLILLAICLLFSWLIYEELREWDCNEYKEYKKAVEVIQKIEDYKKCHGKLPDSLEDIGVKERMEGPVFYDKIDTEKYEVWFSYYFGESCTYHSDTKIWTPY
jgi:hypothetical protein